MTQRQVNLPASVKRVAVMSATTAEMALDLGLEVVTKPSDAPATLAPAATAAGTTILPDFNAIAAAAPDMVLADGSYHSGRTRDFDRFGYPVFTVTVGNYEGLLLALTILGEATGTSDRAGAVRADIEAGVAALVAKAKARQGTLPAPKVLILTGGGRDVFAGGRSTYLGSLVARLGGDNVLASASDGGPIPGFGVVDVGEAARLNPDVVLILPSGQGGLAAQIKGSPAWAKVPAVQAGRIHELDIGRYLRNPGTGAVGALEALLPLLWP
jgi:iron complex transport system substrate-binding protein